MTWHDAPAILVYIAVASALSFWFGSRSKRYDYGAGYKDGREDECARRDERSKT